MANPRPRLTVSPAPTERSQHGDEGQEHEEEHGEEASPKNAEGEAAGKERQEVAGGESRRLQDWRHASDIERAVRRSSSPTGSPTRRASPSSRPPFGTATCRANAG